MKDEKHDGNGQHGITNGEACVTNTIILYGEMSGLVDEGKAVDTDCLWTLFTVTTIRL